MTRATAKRLWEELTGEPFSPSDEAEIAQAAPLPTCSSPCGWCSPQSPCGAMKRAVLARRAS